MAITKDRSVEGGSISQRLSKPLACVLVFLLHNRGDISRLAGSLGIPVDDIEGLRSEVESAQPEVQQLLAAAALVDDKAIAALIRARLAEMLMAAQKPAELRDLATAVARCPDWVLGREKAEQEKGTPSQGDPPQGITGLGEAISLAVGKLESAAQEGQPRGGPPGQAPPP